MVDELDVRVAKDELVLAERAVVLLEEERAERVADVEALDGTLTAAWTRLLGTREARIEAAVAAVAEVDRRLAHARANLERVRALAGDTEATKARQDADERARAAAREAALAALARTHGPDGAKASALLLERELLRERSRLLDDAAYTGSDVLAALGTVVRGNRRAAAAQTTTRQQLLASYGLRTPFEEVGNELLAASELSNVQRGMSALPGLQAKFAAAMTALGQEYRPIAGSARAVSPLVSLLVDGPALESLVWSRTTDQANEYEDYAHRVRSLLVPIDQERRDLAARLAELEAELDALAAG